MGRRLMAMAVLAGAGLSVTAAMPVAAARHDNLLHAQMQRHPQDRSQRPPPRDFRNPQPPDRGARDGRMSEQDRRDLHRDLDRANRELYKGRR